MQKELPYFVEVILPLSLPGTYTYRLPKNSHTQAKIGQRVLVSFGKSRYKQQLYPAIISSIHQNIPSYSVKYIETFLDEMPIVLEKQLDFWKWLATYYCTSLGKILQMGLPAGYKLEQNSYVFLKEEEIKYENLNETEKKTIEILKENKNEKINNLIKKIAEKNIYSCLQNLQNLGYIQIEESIQEKFRPKQQDYLFWTEKYQNQQNWPILLKELEKKPKQLAVILEYISLSAKHKGYVSKQMITEKTKVSSIVFNELFKKNILEVKKINQDRFLFQEDLDSKLPLLSEKKNNVKNQIIDLFQNYASVFLNAGIEKLEILIHLIDNTLKEGKKVLYLLPEIGLTIQIIDFLKNHFGEKVAVYHSKFNMNERTEIWQAFLKKSEPSFSILVSVRSSIFLPLHNIGLIIIDQEHDRNFKYPLEPFYNAKDATLVWAQKNQAKTLLISDTPSLETQYLVMENKIGQVSYVNETIKKNEIKIISIYQDKLKIKPQVAHPLLYTCSQSLYDSINENLNKKKQILIFNYRKGYIPLRICHHCGWRPLCDACDVTMIYYKSTQRLGCNYCGSSKTLTQNCPACGGVHWEDLGCGTETVEEIIQSLFPHASTGRLDAESTRKKNAYQEILTNFEQKKIDILIGTQILSKFNHFENVGLIVVWDADALFQYPHFRTQEQAIQSLVQSFQRYNKVKVLVQQKGFFYDKIEHIKNNNLNFLFNQELEERKQFNYPPYVRFWEIRIKHKNKEQCITQASFLAVLLKNHLAGQADIIGPAFDGIEKIRFFYIQHIWLKIPKSIPLSTIREQVYLAIESFRKCAFHQQGLLEIEVDV